ncbi:DUF4136 domain-containing protein [Lysobacter sp. F60174L2]|uniref:DUF4136 domain-containing protein n=1 Tax=Lysobacter sp. F60174L2 TaxID=3459295 RepID=UPI00403D5744
MKVQTLALMAVLLAACSTTPTVSIDHASSVDFASYRTYYWAKTPDGAAPLVRQRIVDGIDARLAAKGWTPGQGSGDVALAVHVATSQQQTLDTFYSGTNMGGWGWRGGMGMGTASTTVRTYDVGTLIVDMFDTRTQQAIWRGTASDTLPGSPGEINAEVEAALDKMFANFPPGSAAN